jgi:AcrR family transcriptional regulator
MRAVWNGSVIAESADMVNQSDHQSCPNLLSGTIRSMSRVVDTRARRRSAMQETLRAAALAMFAERGYEATTVRDIAEAADVSERTFFRYYPSKSDVLLGDLSHVLDALLRALSQRPSSEPGLTAICHALLSLPSPSGPPGLALLLPPTGSPMYRPDEMVGDRLPATAPSARMLKVFAEWEGGLVTTLLAREGGSSGASAQERLRAEVTARAALGAMRTAIQHRHERAADPDPGLFHDLLREAFAALGVA